MGASYKFWNADMALLDQQGQDVRVMQMGRGTAEVCPPGLIDAEDSPPVTELKFQGRSDHPNFNRYYVIHERPHTLWARIGRKEVRSVLSRVDFHLFRSVNDASLILSRGKLGIVGDAFTRLKMARLLTYSQDTLDLMAVKNAIRASGHVVRGVYFRELKRLHVDSAALFGVNVDDSNEFDDFAEDGRLSRLLIQVSNGAEPRTYGLSSDWSVFVYKAENEHQEIDEVLSLRELIQHALGAQ